MEKPHYGRTGLLASRLSGLPVTQPRLISSTASTAVATGSNSSSSGINYMTNAATSRALKWYPSLLTVPQQLLDALRREDDGVGEDESGGAAAPTAHAFCADPTLLTYLRVATIAEMLVQRYRRSAAAAAAARGPTTPSPPRTEVASLYAKVMQWSREKVQNTAGTTTTPSSLKGGTTFFIPAYKLLVMKEEKRVTEYASVTWRSVWLLGKEPAVNDIALDHPSCSAQHAALEMRFVLVDDGPLTEYVDAHVNEEKAAHKVPPLSFARDTAALRALCEGMWSVLENQLAAADGDATAVWTVELQLTDLGSTNHTKLNGAVVAANEPTTVIETDVLEFGCSTRKYVVLRNA